MKTLLFLQIENLCIILIEDESKQNIVNHKSVFLP
jgi:hypothetical protein